MLLLAPKNCSQTLPTLKWYFNFEETIGSKPDFNVQKCSPGYKTPHDCIDVIAPDYS